MLLNEKSVEELKELLERVKDELEGRKEDSKEFEFEFDATLDSRHGKPPYAARLTHNGAKLEREFFDLDRSWGRKEVTVTGDYTARVGDIIEERRGASRTREDRYWYLVKANGKQTLVAKFESADQKARVVKYLKGKISATELLNN